METDRKTRRPEAGGCLETVLPPFGQVWRLVAVCRSREGDDGEAAVDYQRSQINVHYAIAVRSPDAKCIGVHSKEQKTESDAMGHVSGSLIYYLTG